MATSLPRVLVLRAPLSGAIVPIEAVPDPVFSQRLAGDGVAIDPTSRTLLAPCAGRVAHVHAARHALTLRTAEGLDVLLHVGLDTVALRGEGFRVLVGEQAEVAEGTPLLEFDADRLAGRVRSLLTTVLITTPALVHRLLARTGAVVAGRDVIAEVVLRDGGSAAVAPPECVSPPIVVRMPAGLHARPASVLARAARAFQAHVQLRRGAAMADARSVLALLQLDVAHLDTVTVAASGPDADLAVRHIAALVEAGLGDDVAAGEAGLARPGPRLPASGATSGHPPVTGTLRGVGASPGLAVGRVWRARWTGRAIAEHGADPWADRRALDRAVDAACGELRQLQARLDPGRAGIFAAQEALLADPELVEAAAAGIARGRSAALAWQTAVEDYAGRLDGLANEWIAARAGDLRDVGARVLRLLDRGGRLGPPPPEGTVLVAEDLAPSDVAALDRTRVVGVCTTRGSVTSHAAILARALALPFVVAAHPDALDLADGTLVLLDGTAGTLLVSPDERDMARAGEQQARQAAQRAAWQARAHDPAVTRDGRRVEVLANIGSVTEAAAVVEAGGEGVGLLRSEFLFFGRDVPPSELEQAQALASIVAVLGPGRPLIVRALDTGGDKPLACVPLSPEANPALGQRGLRLLLERPALLRAQLRAVLRAARAGGAVRVMFPMVTHLDEWRQAKAMLAEEAARLGVAPLAAGVMVEVPSAALLAGALAAEAAFLSIGTNDLTQYTLAIDRGHAALAPWADGLHPAVLHLVAHTVAAAGAHGTPVGICGDMAADPQAIPVLVGLGVSSLSVGVAALAAVKARVRGLDAAACRALAHRALGAGTAAEVRALVAANFNPAA